VQLRAGQIIGSTYHTVRVTGDLRKAGEPDERVTAVTSWRDAPYLTGAERTALELAEAARSPNPSGNRVDDEPCARPSARYDHKALRTLTLAAGQMRFSIPPLTGKPLPGIHARWSKWPHASSSGIQRWEPGCSLFARKLSAGPRGVAGREAGNLPGLLKQAGVTAAIPDRATRPHCRRGTGDRGGRRAAARQARVGQADRYPGAPPAPGPGWVSPPAR
jgi:hypothetical protein